MMDEFKILSIVPAQPGWYAVHKDFDGSSMRFAVAVWAAVMDRDGQRVTGFSEVRDGNFCAPGDEATNFIGWEYSPNGPPAPR